MSDGLTGCGNGLPMAPGADGFRRLTFRRPDRSKAVRAWILVGQERIEKHFLSSRSSESNPTNWARPVRGHQPDRRTGQAPSSGPWQKPGIFGEYDISGFVRIEASGGVLARRRSGS